MPASTRWQASSSAGGTWASRRAWISPPTLAARLARSRPERVRIDAARAAVGLVLAPLDQAAALEIVEQADQRRPLDRERRGQFLLPHAVAQAADIDQRPPCRFGETEGAQLGVDRLAQTPGDARDAEAEIDVLGVGHRINIVRYPSKWQAAPGPGSAAGAGGSSSVSVVMPGATKIASAQRRTAGFAAWYLTS